MVRPGQRGHRVELPEVRHPLSYPASETGLIIGIWFVIGLIVLAYLYARHPERLPEMKKVFADDVPPEPIPSGGTA